MATSVQQVAQLEVLFASRGFEQQDRNIKATAANADKAEKSVKGLSAANQNASAVADKAAAASRKNAQAIDLMGQSAERSSAALRGLGGFIVGAFSLQTIANVVRTGDAYQRLQSRLKVLIGDTQQYQRVSQSLNDVAETNGTTLQDTVEVFARMRLGLKDLGKSDQEIIRVTDAVQKLGVIGGSSQAALQAGLQQFGQALSSGIVRAEEMNSLLENIPLVAKAAADGFGLTAGQLRRLVVEGKVASEDFFAALQSQLPKINQQFESMPNNIARAGGQFTASWSNMIGQIDDSIGVSRNAANAISFLAENVETLGKVAVILAAAGLPAVIMGIGRALIALAPVVTGLFGPAGLLVAGVGAAIGALIAYRKEINEVYAAWSKFRDSRDAQNPMTGFVTRGRVGAVPDNTNPYGVQQRVPANQNFMPVPKPKPEDVGGLREVTALMERYQKMYGELGDGTTGRKRDPFKNFAYSIREANSDMQVQIDLMGQSEAAIGELQKRQEFELMLRKENITLTKAQRTEIEGLFAEYERLGNLLQSQEKLRDLSDTVKESGLEAQNAKDRIRYFGQSSAALDVMNRRRQFELDLQREGITLTEQQRAQTDALFAEYASNASVVEYYDQVNDGLRDLARTGDDAFKKLIFNNEKLGDSLKTLGRQILEVIYNMTLAQTFQAGIGSIGSSILSGIGSVFGGGGGGMTPVPAQLPSIPTFGGFAEGGSFQVGGSGATDSQVVAFKATPGEKVSIQTPQQQAQMNGSNAAVYNFNIDARGAQQGVEQNIKAAVREAMSSVPSIAVQSVVDARRRNPKLFG